MAAMGAGHIVVSAESFANSYGNRFFPDIKMGETRHQSAGVEFVDLLFE